MRKWAQRGLATCPRSHSQLKVSKPVALTPKPELCLPHKHESGDVKVGRAAGAALAHPGCSGPCDPGERCAGARPTLSPYVASSCHQHGKRQASPDDISLSHSSCPPGKSGMLFETRKLSAWFQKATVGSQVMGTTGLREKGPTS